MTACSQCLEPMPLLCTRPQHAPSDRSGDSLLMTSRIRPRSRSRDAPHAPTLADASCPAQRLRFVPARAAPHDETPSLLRVLNGSAQRPRSCARRAAGWRGRPAGGSVRWCAADDAMLRSPCRGSHALLPSFAALTRRTRAGASGRRCGRVLRRVRAGGSAAPGDVGRALRRRGRGRARRRLRGVARHRLRLAVLRAPAAGGPALQRARAAVRQAHLGCERGRSRSLLASEPLAAWMPAIAASGAWRHRLRSAAPRCVCDTLVRASEAQLIRN